MTATFLNKRTGHVVSDSDVRAILDSRSSKPSSSGREAFTDRLGLPASATDEEFLAALDTKLAERRPSPAPTPEDALYASIFGSAERTPTPEDAVYASIFGA